MCLTASLFVGITFVGITLVSIGILVLRDRLIERRMNNMTDEEKFNAFNENGRI